MRLTKERNYDLPETIRQRNRQERKGNLVARAMGVGAITPAWTTYGKHNI